MAQLVAANFVASQQRGSVAGTAPLGHAGPLTLARALAEENPGEALFRYGPVAGGGTRTVRFGLEGLAELLPRVKAACVVR